MGQDEKPKSDEEILFPEVEIQGIKLKPWSFGQLSRVSPALRKGAKALIDGGMTMDNLKDHVSDVAFVLLEQGPEIISHTTGIALAEIQEWDPVKAIPVLIVIVSQNLEKIKNFFGPSLALLNQIKK
jgi:hypothetical protein